jgi:serine/threonine protein kinase
MPSNPLRIMGMSETISREEFVKRVSESGLLSGVDLRASLDRLAGVAGVSNASELARSLVDAGRLTSFQADAILDGRLQQLFIDNYTILSRLGAGGMGTVFKARHRRMNRVVALKILSRDTSGDCALTQRFQREVETIGQLSHPNIVMAYDAGEVENGLYLVMEYVDGQDLAAGVKQGGPLSTADATDCILQAARGLACAHNHGIVHRDVKPANLLRDSAGVVKVADLGLAHLSNSDTSSANASLTQVGNILGTADYMSPEQAMDSTTVDHRVDIYSLGCSLFFLLGGRPMYSAGSLMALLLKHRDAPIPSLCHARADVPAELDELYRRMAAKKPEDRFPSMAEVVHALERLKGAVALSDARPARGGPSQAGASPTNVTIAADPLLSIDSSDLGLSDALTAVGIAPSSSEVRRVSDLRVLLVEPSRFQARIVHKYLLELRIENVLTTGSGQQALELAKREGTNVVMSSLHLGDMTGVQLAQALHDDPGCSGVGFVLVSSDCYSAEAGKLRDVPLTALLAKPIDLRRLAQSLAQATGRILEEILS